MVYYVLLTGCFSSRTQTKPTQKYRWTWTARLWPWTLPPATSFPPRVARHKNWPPPPTATALLTMTSSTQDWPWLDCPRIQRHRTRLWEVWRACPWCPASCCWLLSPCLLTPTLPTPKTCWHRQQGERERERRGMRESVCVCVCTCVHLLSILRIARENVCIFVVCIRLVCMCCPQQFHCLEYLSPGNKCERQVVGEGGGEGGRSEERALEEGEEGKGNENKLCVYVCRGVGGWCRCLWMYCSHKCTSVIANLDFLRQMYH